ncbi:MAG: hypothetical protein NTW86_06995, partial [Candidatus Sumerlaeota bacterium]|nr:hypothetical protein [Candidatus Sumerlaeota bacterium]
MNIVEIAVALEVVVVDGHSVFVLLGFRPEQFASLVACQVVPFSIFPDTGMARRSRVEVPFLAPLDVPKDIRVLEIGLLPAHEQDQARAIFGRHGEAFDLHKAVDLWLQVFGLNGTDFAPPRAASNQLHPARGNVSAGNAKGLFEVEPVAVLPQTLGATILGEEKLVFAALDPETHVGNLAERHEPILELPEQAEPKIRGAKMDAPLAAEIAVLACELRCGLVV